MKFKIYRKRANGDTFDINEFEYEQPKYNGYKMPMAHCDQSILHAPGECQYCDHYPEAQAFREFWRINFTGHHDDNKAPCPSTYFRSDATRDLWPGNTANGYYEPQPDGHYDQNS